MHVYCFPTTFRTRFGRNAGYSVIVSSTTVLYVCHRGIEELLYEGCVVCFPLLQRRSLTLTEQIRGAGENIHEQEKAKQAVETEKVELQTSVEEVEVRRRLGAGNYKFQVGRS